jgi:hypothetical protein
VTTDKQVFFILAIDNAHGDDAKEPDAVESKVMDLNTVADRIHNHLRTVTFLQDHARARETRHR